MARVLTDREIDSLIAEPKTLPDNWRTRLRPRRKQRYQYDERELLVQGKAGNNFRVIARRNRQNPLDFSLVLTLEESDGAVYRLVRYNGVHPSRHSNKWEKERSLPNGSFGPTFHIPRATERYQLAGYAIDGYAEPTVRYRDFESALDAFLDGCGFERPPSDQLPLL